MNQLINNKMKIGMKKLMTLFLSFTLTMSFAQMTTTIFNEVNNSYGLAIDGDNLYIAAVFENSIYHLDWTETNPTPSILIDSLERPNGIAFHDGYIYACLNSNTDSQDKIVRIDISQPNPIAEDFVVLTNPTGIVFRNNEMYISSGTSIYYVDTESNNPTPIELLSDLNISVFSTIGLCILDNYLFISEGGGVTKYNIDLPNPNREIVVTGLQFVNGLTNYKDEKLLFVSYSPDMVYEVDIVAETYTALFPSNLITPWDIITNSEDLVFVTNIEGGEVNQIDISTVSIEEVDDQDVSIYPNPTFDFINIDNIEEINNASIFNVLGQEVVEIKIEGNTNIDVRNLSEGIYFLKIGDRNPAKFIKR
jgi:hypothetical protein